MSIEASGSLLNFEFRRSGTSDAFKRVVCTTDSNGSITSSLTKRATNCGKKGAPAKFPDFQVTLNAVQDANPDANEANYQDIDTYIKNGYKADFRYASAADAASGLGFGDAIYQQGSGYFTELGNAGSAEDGEVITYSFTFESVGTLGTFDTAS